MKRFALVMIVLSVALTGNLVGQIKVNASGYVGINNANPAYRLDVSGTMRISAGSGTIIFENYNLYPSSGIVSLGTSLCYWDELYAVQGYFYYDPIIMSDLNLKTNITGLLSMKDKVRLLRPVTFNFITDNKIIKDNELNNLQYGFVAQELQEIFPDLVIKRDDGALGVRYTGLIPVMVQALKEQQDEIDGLKKRISDLEKLVK